MNILIIDSHKGEIHKGVTSLHVRNAIIMAEYLGATVIPSNDEYNEIAYDPRWDVVIFNSSSGYAEIDKEILDNKKHAKLIYIVNDYVLGEPVNLWHIIKRHNLKFDVIANHEQKYHKKLSKSKWVNKWDVVNLNSLIYGDMNIENPKEALTDLFDIEEQKKSGVIYWGAFRKDRVEDYRRYFDNRMIISTSYKNHEKFIPYSNGALFIDKLEWYPIATLRRYKASLYIEDEAQHTDYSHLANRFYESISCNVPVIFDSKCKLTMEQSGYNVPDSLICKDANELHRKALNGYIPDVWRRLASIEKADALKRIKGIIDEKM